MWIALSLAGCLPSSAPDVPLVPAPPDLAEALGEGEVRAGVITDSAALFGGISAEGQPGDVKIYNDRVQFVVQGVRPGSFYLVEGGGLIDADIVRPDGVIGRDLVEEWGTMFGLGRVMVPERIEVVNDGSDGEAAVVRVEGYEGPLGLIEGALETPGFVPDLHLQMAVEYRLPPDSWLIEVTATATATTEEATIAIGDLLMGAGELVGAWVPGSGFDGASGSSRLWSGYVSDRNDVALILAAAPGNELQVAGYDILTELADMVVGFSPDQTLAPGTGEDGEGGGSATWTRYYGVGPDLATLSGAVLDLHGAEVQQASGTVTAPDGPVAGARVLIDVDGTPYTVAITDADGAFAATVPSGALSMLAEGRGDGLFTDMPPGAAPVSPYSAPPVFERSLAALSEGAVDVPVARGRGVGSPGSPLTLAAPATLEVVAPDGLPFTVRAASTAPDPIDDPARIPRRPNGLAAAGWSRDGEIALLVEEGTYDVLVHRGPRYELHTETVTVTAGGSVRIEADLPAAFAHPGWVLGDPHTHASPSADGGVSMEDRLVVTSAVGVQVHFGTDHDHLADYRPLLEPLSLSSVLKSVVSDEVSPPVRGHFNIYPVEPDATQPNNGSWVWWAEIPESTEALIDTLRARHGPDFILQSNHPTDAGVADSAGWVPGQISRGDYWTERLGAVEVLNAGDHEDFVPFWMDLVGRGYALTPIGVSDSHDHFGGHVGWSATWIAAGTDDPSALTDDVLAEAIRAGQVVPMRGPFLDIAPLPGATLDPGATVEVEVRSASWVTVDRLRLLENGVEIEVVEGRRATFALQPDRDAWYVVIAEGDTPMQPLTNDTPWALAGPWRVDVGGDGWRPPLPALEVR